MECLNNMKEETLLNHLKLTEIIHKSKMKKYVLVLGETHGNENEYECYFNLIEKLYPSCLLYEIDNIVTYPYPKIDNWIKEHQNKVIMCDMPSKDKEEALEKILKQFLPEEYRKPIYDNQMYSERLSNYNNDYPELNLKRLFNNEKEIYICRIILEHIKENEIIVVVVGHKHAGECSYIHNILKGKTDYIAFWKNAKYCRQCGIDLSEDNKNKNCDLCGADLYNLMIIKDNKDKKI